MPPPPDVVPLAEFPENVQPVRVASVLMRRTAPPKRGVLFARRRQWVGVRVPPVTSPPKPIAPPPLLVVLAVVLRAKVQLVKAKFPGLYLKNAPPPSPAVLSENVQSVHTTSAPNVYTA